jgi:hypothetical protein
VATHTALPLTGQQSAELTAIAQSRCLPAGFAFRAKLILMLAHHPHVQLHFTPTYSSWLNQVEVWFGKIEHDVIARSVFSSVRDLARELRRYINAYSANARPIQWGHSDPTPRMRPNDLSATGPQNENKKEDSDINLASALLPFSGPGPELLRCTAHTRLVAAELFPPRDLRAGRYLLGFEPDGSAGKPGEAPGIPGVASCV